MNVAWVVPGGLGRSAETRVIPALQWLLARLANKHRVVVVSLAQEPVPGEWSHLGLARVINVGRHPRRWGAARALREVHDERPIDIVHAFWAVGAGGAAAAFAARARVPLVVHVAGGELVSLPDIRYGGAVRWRTRWEARRVLKRAAAVTVASGSMRELVRRAGRDADLVPLGVDLQGWPPKRIRRREPGELLRLVHVASLNGVKDQQTLIEACAQLADAGIEFTLDVVGEDTLGGTLQRTAAARGLAQITWHGFKTQRALQSIVEDAHLFLLCSRHEAGPVAVLEAAVCGVPTVGTAVGHVADLAPDAALAVPVRDAAALAQAILTLARDDERRLALARAAQAWATAHDADHTFALVDALYRRVTGADR